MQPQLAAASSAGHHSYTHGPFSLGRASLPPIAGNGAAMMERANKLNPLQVLCANFSSHSLSHYLTSNAEGQNNLFGLLLHPLSYLSKSITHSAPLLNTMSTSTLKPIKVWGKGGPNPPKVAIVLEELGLPHEVVVVPFSDVKKPEFLAINPNGRLPAIHDPNTGLTLWESGAIVEYLAEKYDTQHKISFAPGSAEAYESKQYLYFQASGQGPYYGQAAWFKKFHPEPLPSALDRYVKEVNRVTGVLEKVLSDKKAASSANGPWLVGGKCSIADLSFVSWTNVITIMFGKDDYNLDDYPLVKDWHERMVARPATAAGLGKSEKMA